MSRVGLFLLFTGLALILLGAVSLGNGTGDQSVARLPAAALVASPFLLLLGSLVVIAGELRRR